ncbi:hypothetical protein [Streptomyces sp. NPDC056670]|uniref:hypothetical protein n=1 Tax=Streptomyces sp. NPDC056670 TaxID=3345904 RepID=UPI0036CDEECB
MTEFIRQLLLDQFPAYPISIDLRSADWGFVHWSVSRDRLRAGVDTYTGLPH